MDEDEIHEWQELADQAFDFEVERDEARDLARDLLRKLRDEAAYPDRLYIEWVEKQIANWEGKVTDDRGPVR